MRVTITPEPPAGQQTAGAETDAAPQPVSRVSPDPVQGVLEWLRALIAGIARLLAVPLVQSRSCPRCQAPLDKYADAHAPRQYRWDAVVVFHCRICGYTWEESTWYDWWWD